MRCAWMLVAIFLSGWAAPAPGQLPPESEFRELPPVAVGEDEGSRVADGFVTKSGLYGGAEIIFFKPFGEAGTTPQEAIAASGAEDFLPAWRLWGGWSDSDGLGARIRWWQYDQFSTASDLTGTATSRLIFQKLDLEATQQVGFGSWDMMLSCGVTWIGNELDLGVGGGGDFDRWRMDAAGVTAGVQAVRRSRRFECCRWFGSAQASGVFGNSVSQTQSDPIGAQPSTVGGILEFAVGPRWERSIGGGATAFAGGNAEAQYWMTGLGSLADGLVPDGQGTLGLVGLSVNVGIRR
jgi:hypothetical protein